MIYRHEKAFQSESQLLTGIEELTSCSRHSTDDMSQSLKENSLDVQKEPLSYVYGGDQLLEHDSRALLIWQQEDRLI